MLADQPARSQKAENSSFGQNYKTKIYKLATTGKLLSLDKVFKILCKTNNKEAHTAAIKLKGKGLNFGGVSRSKTLLSICCSFSNNVND